MGKKSVIVGVMVLALLALLGWWYFQAEKEILQISILAAIIIVLVAGIILIILTVMHSGTKNKLRKVLQEIERRLPQESAETLRDAYTAAYALYLKLSEQDKQNFYARIIKIRERLEEQLQAAKTIEELLAKSNRGDVQQLQEIYFSLREQIGKLPAAIQERYHAPVMLIKERLEKGF